MLLVKVNFIRFRPGRRCRVPIRFINDDLNDELTKGTFISRCGPYMNWQCGSVAKQGEHGLCIVGCPCLTTRSGRVYGR